MKRYQREMARQNEAEEARRNCRISVYTIEEGTQRQRQTIIDYNTQMPPPRYKEEELPPAYYEAIQMSIDQPQRNATIDPQNSNGQPRRNSAVI